MECLWHFGNIPTVFLSFPVCCDKVTIFFHFTLIFIFIVSLFFVSVLPVKKFLLFHLFDFGLPPPCKA